MGAHYTWYGVRVKENKGHNPGGPWIDAACPDSLPSPCPANRLFPQIAFPPSSMNVRLPGPPQLLCISSLCLLDPSACAYSTALWDDLGRPGPPARAASLAQPLAQPTFLSSLPSVWGPSSCSLLPWCSERFGPFAKPKSAILHPGQGHAPSNLDFLPRPLDPGKLSHLGMPSSGHGFPTSECCGFSTCSITLQSS